MGVMVKIRIHKRKEKRREGKGMLLPALLFFLLFPYIISGFSDVKKQTLAKEDVPGQIWVLQKRVWGSQKIPLEEYLMGMIAATIPVEYEPETLKAQAVILRSYCINHMKKEAGEKIIYDDVLQGYYFSPKECKKMWEENAEDNLTKIEKAVQDTQGLILVCDGDIVEAPFCRMSNGKSRDITEYVVRKENYKYMKSEVCEKDGLAKDFVQYTEINQEEFEKILKKLMGESFKGLKKITLYRDANSYVKEVQVGEKLMEGEQFREALGLVSSCFSLDKINDVIEIQTKGIGHGFGFSQYEANEQAKNGKDYTLLLHYFFQNITLEKI